MFNKITLIGNLGRDPEIRTLENGAKVGTFSLATHENYKDKNDNWQSVTDWHNIVVWRYLAEKSERELKKGSLVFIEGKMTYRKYQDKDGIERSAAEVVASNVQLLEKREVSGQKSGFPPGLDDTPSLPKDSGSNSGADDLPF
ncbi:MAG: single-stranded DNA-binding protein [Saprospiraceae bacterium]|nr:single-stranded DNA-binding protein [Saprospiraceae bacterium]MBK6566945.1 single-stranded DNA-binding protein [Saprospiraceae bacterium]MBK6783832.1 single-stranded DNA-binding protein [Saprospiraceae bacterium]MBK7525041.1 single-stranded DNA-binding protein [Saprospiraceae bacterium]MBK8372397.1 single-stranded DNA-binding protein [Saprospiraceae bacterium]